MPTINDVDLAQSVLTWTMKNRVTDENINVLTGAGRLSNNVAAAMRFTDSSDIGLVAVDRSLAGEDRYLGRSVRVLPSQSRVPVTGWIASWEEPFDVVILDDLGRFRKIRANADCLIEDGTL
jgi:hypothetical protein